MDREEQYKEYLYQEYLKSHAASNGGDKPNGTNVTQEMPDYISTGERMIAKNFANSPESQLKYYQQEHPDKEFAINDGEVVSRSKGDQQWKQIDPSFSPISNPLGTLKDIPADIGDVLYDGVAGTAQGLAATAGFLAGGKNRMAKAMAASGAAGGALEAGRQGLGKLAGIPQDVSGGDTAVATGLGALNPLMFGVNKIPGGKELVGDSSGLIKKGLDYVGPKAVQFATGISPEVQKVYNQDPEAIKQMYDQGGHFPLAQKLADKAVNWAEDKKKDLLRTAGETQQGVDKVDITAVKKAVLDHIAALESKPEISVDERKIINGLKNVYNNNFGLDEAIVPNMTNVKEVKPLYNDVTRLMKTAQESRPANFTKPLQEIKAPNLTYEPSHDDFLSQIHNVVNGGLADDRSALQKSSNELAAAYNIKNQAQKESLIKQKLAEIKAVQDRLTQTEKSDIQPGARAFDMKQRLKAYSDSLMSQEAKVNPLNADINVPVNTAYHALNDAFTQASGGATKAANEAAAEFANGTYPGIMKNFATKGEPDAQKAYQTAMNLGKASKLNAYGMLTKGVESGELKLPEINQLKALDSYYGPGDNFYINDASKNNPFTNLSGLQKVLGTLGGIAGYKLGGGGYAGISSGALAGGGLGKAMASKQAARLYGTIGNLVDDGAVKNYLTNPAYYPANNQLLNPWAKKPNEP